MNGKGPRWHIETTLVHGTGNAETTGPTLPPVTLSTAFVHGSAEEMEAAFAGRSEAPLYSRLSNPTVAALEQRIADACGAPGAVAVASGMTAIALGLLTLLKAGDELIASPYLFGGTYTLLTRTLADLGITTHFADPREPARAEAMIGPRTRAVFLEAIANPAMVVPPFKAWRALCDAHGLALLVDATLLTPCLYDAEAIGADVLFFSASKYLAGAASTVGGLIVDTGRCPWPERPGLALGDFAKGTPTAFLAKLRKRQLAAVGPCLSPMSAFLLLTGLETLPLRLERQCDNAGRVAGFLAEHPKVGEVLFPGLPTHPAHALSRAQFRGRFGSLLSFRLADKAACFRFLNACRLVARVTNLGDTRTMALHPASTIYATFWQHEQQQVGVTEDLIRLSLGIEHPADILADLEQALGAA
jgi:O-acetylhomoserine (thiol)-lyase